MKRYDIIRHLIEQRGYKSYLEIGVLGNETYNSLPTLDVKHSVDPNGQAVFNVTSDEFFERHCNQSYDIIFIDGLHLAEQVQRDIENSLTHLNDGGIIVVHDCLPSAEYEQLREGVSGKPWTGDVWKAFAALRADRRDLIMRVVDTDYGCGLIERGVDPCVLVELRPIDGYTWDFFCKHRNKIMGVITVEQFIGCA
jgi:hypothetical protein